MIADTLFRAYDNGNLEMTSEWDKLITSHISLITSKSEINNNLLQKIRNETVRIPELKALNNTILKVWPKNNKK